MPDATPIRRPPKAVRQVAEKILRRHVAEDAQCVERDKNDPRFQGDYWERDRKAKENRIAKLTAVLDWMMQP